MRSSRGMNAFITWDECARGKNRGYRRRVGPGESPTSSGTSLTHAPRVGPGRRSPARSLPGPASTGPRARVARWYASSVHRFAWFLAIAFGVGCGARTGLDESGDAGARKAGPGAPGEPPGSWAVDGGPFGAYSGVLCSLHAGPVDSCDAGAAAGPAQRCNWLFPICSNQFPPNWGCCSTNDVGGEVVCGYPVPGDSCR